MSSIINGITNIGESLKTFSLDIISGIGDFFKELWQWLEDIVTTIGYLPVVIDNGIRMIFVPDTENLKLQFDQMLDSISSSFGISFESINDFKNNWSEKPVSDISSDYTLFGVGTLKLKFLDTSYLINGIERFRPVIRGFVVFLLILYNYYQMLTFIGQDPKIMATAEKEYHSFLNRKEK